MENSWTFSYACRPCVLIVVCLHVWPCVSLLFQAIMSNILKQPVPAEPSKPPPPPRNYFPPIFPVSDALVFCKGFWQAVIFAHFGSAKTRRFLCDSHQNGQKLQLDPLIGQALGLDPSEILLVFVVGLCDRTPVQTS